MDMDLFDDFIQSLSEAVSYAKGDKTKGRSMIIDIPNDELEAEHIFFDNFARLPDSSKQKAMQYVNELLHAANE